ncbi:hypothetical protein AWB76_02933 [Caballeronia temeraria]|uniref:Uncharacterized protein n=1 Tax=Caballeronia temeraria TaxID=1777137 RepID=A0A158ARF2_9BURK|nr:hypothetical protein [Caballeronia temeraria]SAK60601.1 hypothetical protein AWB76_02933 [Caballeronia temeraria]
MSRLGSFDRPVTQTAIDQAGDGAIGEQSAVLLKNTNNLLPFDPEAIRSVALIGQSAYAGKAVSGWLIENGRSFERPRFGVDAILSYGIGGPVHLFAREVSLAALHCDTA